MRAEKGCAGEGGRHVCVCTGLGSDAHGSAAIALREVVALDLDVA